MNKHTAQRFLAFLSLLALVFSSLAWAASSETVQASHTDNPTSVTLVGSLQDELGCSSDWDPTCTDTYLTYDGDDDVWQRDWDVPAGDWFYKVALNDSWDENYGANAQQNGADIPLILGETTSVKFYYDHKSHWVTDNVNSVIATVPGSFQSELGCPGDWDPGCLRSWLQDPDGDGLYEFTTSGLPAGSYEAKVAIDEGWAENYGAGGVPGGANIPFTVAQNNAPVVFRYDSTTHILTILAGHGADNNVEYFGLGHNSHDDLYRVPFGAITPGTDLILRFRTYHQDVTGVRVRFYDTATRSEFFQDMEVAAAGVSCYDPSQVTEACDFWQTAYTPNQPTTLYYRFIVRDGTATAYYDDDYFQDGGWGEAKPNLEDDSYAVAVYDPAFEPLDWLQNGVVYQIFPDRFRDGRSNNNPSTTEPRYGYPPETFDQIILKEWGDLPEGYCRHYVDPAEPCVEGPRGRDYFGGDLSGVDQRLNYLSKLGVTVIYFNPIFEAGSNHAYDTQDYYAIDHFFGTQKDWGNLVKRAEKYGIRVILDGVFNHVSSDSPYFDRYGHFDSLGACESLESPYRDWFYFHDVTPGDGACVGSSGTPNAANYTSWFGFDSIPVLNKDNPEVRDLIYAGSDSVTRYWLDRGASGWRLDVMGDPSFPADFWPEFRDVVKSTDPDAAIIGELWKKHEVLAFNQGDRADTAMNYRFRNAILGFFGEVDDKGFPDDGQSDQPPSLFASKLTSVREDNPDATYYTLLNLMDSHDTRRILWSLTPGEENREDKEFDLANLERGKGLLRLATVVQMTVPGAPTIYYGDEVGVTGADDPDDRRTFPWDDGEGEFGHTGDQDLLDHYQLLTALRDANPVFRQGELTFLLTDDASRTMAYLMRTADAVAIVAINRSEEPQTLTIELDGMAPDALAVYDALGGLPDVTAYDGVLTVQLDGLSAAVLLPAPGQDLVAPPAPTNLMVEAEAAGEVSLRWKPAPGSARYQVYRSPVTGGGYVLVGETTGATFTDTGLENARWYYYVVRAVDAAGNLGPASNEASGMPHYTIGWANLQWPPTMSHTISAVNRTDTAYGQVWIDGITEQPGPTPSLVAQLGFGPEGSQPGGNQDWTWVDAAFNVDTSNNDEFMASMLPETTGVFDYVYRYSTTGGRDWLYADLSGPVSAGELPPNPGKLTVNPSDDTTPPATPTGLHVVIASPDGVELAWDAVEDDPTLYGYEVLRSSNPGGPYTQLARVTETSYTDIAVDVGQTYYYVVRSVDLSFNRSDFSDEVAATAERRIVSVIFNVTVPTTTPPGSTVYIAGTLNLLDGGLPEWDPGAVFLEQEDTYLWTITLTGIEGTNIEYKYTLGSWDYVEKGAACEELANRTLILDYGSTGEQVVNDEVLNWRNVAPCGD